MTVYKYTDLFAPEDISIEKCWFVVSNAIFKGQQISQVQHDEMKRTFFIGFTECFKIMSDLSETLTEEKAADVLTRINDEARKFIDHELEKAKARVGT